LPPLSHAKQAHASVRGVRPVQHWLYSLGIKPAAYRPDLQRRTALNLSNYSLRHGLCFLENSAGSNLVHLAELSFHFTKFHHRQTQTDKQQYKDSNTKGK
jgi:hypothetical protein